MDDEDSLLERIAEVDGVEENGKKTPSEDEPLDYTEDEEMKSENGEVSDGEIVEEAKVEKEEGELEDGELEDSDEEDGEVKKDILSPPREKIRFSDDDDRRDRRIEVCSSNDSRLSRPGSSRPIIRSQIPPRTKTERAMASYEQALLDAKNAMNRASTTRQEDPDYEHKQKFAAPTGEREYGRRDDLSSDEFEFESDARKNIPSLFDIRTRTPPRMPKKDLGPQVLYPTRDRERQPATAPAPRYQNNNSRNMAPNRTGREEVRRRRSPPPKSVSPERRGMSFSPTQFAENISSDSDSDAMQRKPRKTSTSSSATSVSKSTYSSKSSDSEDETRKRRKNSGGKLRNVSPGTPSPPRRNVARHRNRSRSSSGTPSPSRIGLKNHQNNKRYMKRKSGNSHMSRSPPPRRDRSRSPPPYPPGMKPSKRDSAPTGDIHSYRIPLRKSGNDVAPKKDRNDRNVKKDAGLPHFLKGREKSQKRGREASPPSSKSKKKKVEATVQEISSSSGSESSVASEKRNSRKRGKREKSPVSVSSESKSSSARSSRSSSTVTSRSGSNSPTLPARYQEALQQAIDSSSDDEAPKKQAVSRTPSPPPPPPKEELMNDDEPPPPPPPDNQNNVASKKAEKAALKMRLSTINKMLHINALDTEAPPS